MKHAYAKFILWNETIGFSFLIFLTWLAEFIGIPRLMFNEEFAINWHRAGLRTLAILLIWGWVHWMTRRLLKRLHYLENFLRVCSWCRKVSHEDEWVTMEEYFNSKYAAHTTHGVCPTCLEKKLQEVNQRKKSLSV